jgi:hypothetical protein
MLMSLAALYPSYKLLHRPSGSGKPVGWVEPTGPARSGRPDDRLRETHHLLLCYARAVTNYRRNFICGGSFFFTANLAERRLRLLVDDIVSAKDKMMGFAALQPILPR